MTFLSMRFCIIGMMLRWSIIMPVPGPVVPIILLTLTRFERPPPLMLPSMVVITPTMVVENAMSPLDLNALKATLNTSTSPCPAQWFPSYC